MQTTTNIKSNQKSVKSFSSFMLEEQRELQQNEKGDDLIVVQQDFGGSGQSTPNHCTTPKKTPSKVITINKSPNQQHKHSPHKSKKSIVSFAIVEPDQQSTTTTSFNQKFNNNNHQNKKNQNQSITPTVSQPNSNFTTPISTPPPKIIVEKKSELVEEEKDDICLDNIHQEEEDKLEQSSYCSDISDTDDVEQSLSSGSESDTGISSEESTRSELTKSTSMSDFIPLSSSHVEQVKISNNIKLEDFQILHLVGKGGFGKVHQVMHKKSSKIYALKTIKKNHIIQRKSVINTLAEKDILKRIEHPFIVKLHYAFQNEKKLYLVMDFINGGQLFYHLQKESIFSETQVRFYIAELVLALEHLHDLNVIHRDLKPENILIDSQGHCVLTDFGLAKEQVTDDSTGSMCGTLEYTSPEMIQGKNYGKAVDWWAIGILMYDMLIGKPPFESKNRQVAQEKIVKEKPNFPPYIGSSARSLINALLQKDPKKRLGSNGGATEIKKHPFFKGVQWRKLELKELPSPYIPKTSDIRDISNFDMEFLKQSIRDSYSASPNLSSSQQAFFDGFSFVRSTSFLDNHLTQQLHNNNEQNNI
ncbi:putative protein serine/threonine kinase [Tieghemostelium lacteum]|uniref:non-specific serine/threonine protein kinase n=1 Tax=Tieghemostelium lacteum TaxID=361077 RepID=A0A151Z2K8_TIELA|nr:putative protein serine/threonine kinase [Tieghemostelium lacteum]|eukprot:KYQ88168.1 putative protein serine/threonine kinase [Tieghemostelium lacteum]